MTRKRMTALRYPNDEIIELVTEPSTFTQCFHTYRLGWTDWPSRRYVRTCDAGLRSPASNPN
jgi:hypothetical protein